MSYAGPPDTSLPQSVLSSGSPLAVESEINWGNIPVFGSPLYEQLKENNKEVNSGLLVPLWISQLCSALRTFIKNKLIPWSILTSLPSHTLHTDQVPRIYADLCGFKKEIQWQPDLSVAFLQYLLEMLPAPILTFDLHEQWLSLSRDIWPHDKRIYFLQFLLSILPETNLNTLKEIIPIFVPLKNEQKKMELFYFWGPLFLLRHGTHEYDKEEVAESATLFSILLDNADIVKNTNSRTTLTPVPGWLKTLSDSKQSLVRDVKAKLTRIISLLTDLAGNVPSEPSVGEFLQILHYILIKMDVVEAKIDSTRVYEIYHINRLFRYLSDLDETMQAHGPKENIHGHDTAEINRLNQKSKHRQLVYLQNSRFRARLFLLIIAMLHEFERFVESSFLSSDVIRLENHHKIQLEKHIRGIFTQGHIQTPLEKQAYEWWCTTFSSTTMAVPWEHFVKVIGNVLKLELHLSSSSVSGFKHLVDPYESEYVTCWRIARSVFKCWYKKTAKETIESCFDTAKQEYFHPYISREEIRVLFDKQPEKTFCIRFSSSQPGFAIHWKIEQNSEAATIVALVPAEYSYAISEDNTSLHFSEITEIVSHYRGKQILSTSFADKIYRKANFYGGLEVDDTNYFLKDQPEGTYLVRFSGTFRDQLVVSYSVPQNARISTPVEHVRVERTKNGHIIYRNHDYITLDFFLQENNFCKPYRDTVSSLFEEGEQWREQWINYGFKSKPKELETLFHSPHQQIVYEESPSETLETLLSSRRSLASVQDHFVKLVVANSEADSIIAQNPAHQFFSSEKKPWLVQANSLRQNELYTYPIKISNPLNIPVKFTILESGILDRKYFYSVSVDQKKNTVQISKERDATSYKNISGEILPGQEVIMDIVVVMYQPVELKRVVTIVFQWENQLPVYYYIPVLFIGSVDGLCGEDKQPENPYWTLDEQYLEDNETMHRSSEENGIVLKCSLFGVFIVVKRWKKGLINIKDDKSDWPPRAFQRELGIFREIKHANLVTFVGANVTENTCSVAMEYCSEGNLGEFLQSHIDIKDVDRINIALDICYVMHFLHSLNKMHRDLKPANLLVDSSLRIKLADFGIAKTNSALHQTYHLGTPVWMAPEVTSAGSYYTNKCDVFPFALIVYQLCNHKPPDRNYSDISTGWCPTLQREWVERIPVFSEIIDLCSQKVPSKRPSYEKLINMLLVALNAKTQNKEIMARKVH